jgi:hypothetical protein
MSLLRGVAAPPACRGAPIPRAEPVASTQSYAPGYFVSFRHWSFVLLDSLLASSSSSSIHIFSIPSTRATGQLSSSTNIVDNGLRSAGALLVSGAGRGRRGSLGGLFSAAARLDASTASPPRSDIATRHSMAGWAATNQPVWLDLPYSTVNHVVSAILDRVIAVDIYWAKRGAFRQSRTYMVGGGWGELVSMLGCAPQTCNQPSPSPEPHCLGGGWLPRRAPGAQRFTYYGRHTSSPEGAADVPVQQFSFAGISISLQARVRIFGSPYANEA